MTKTACRETFCLTSAFLLCFDLVPALDWCGFSVFLRVFFSGWSLLMMTDSQQYLRCHLWSRVTPSYTPDIGNIWHPCTLKKDMFVCGGIPHLVVAYITPCFGRIHNFNQCLWGRDARPKRQRCKNEGRTKYLYSGSCGKTDSHKWCKDDFADPLFCSSWSQKVCQSAMKMSTAMCTGKYLNLWWRPVVCSRLHALVFRTSQKCVICWPAACSSCLRCVYCHTLWKNEKSAHERWDTSISVIDLPLRSLDTIS